MDRLKNMRKRKEVSPPTSTLGSRNRSPGFLSQLQRSSSPFRRSPSSSNPIRSPSIHSLSDQSGGVDVPSPSSSHLAVDKLDLPSYTPKTSNDGLARDLNLTQPSKPAFLKLSDDDLMKKFLRINEEDERRARPRPNDPTYNAQWARPQLLEAKVLDRYANIHPWDYNRIRLQVPDGQTDYINASPITLHNVATGNVANYIAMQGPKWKTVNHVWRMIWDALPDPATIVMLTATHEEGIEKCYPYFPQREGDDPLIINEDDEHKDGFKATVELQRIEREQDQHSTILEVRYMVMTLDPDYAASINATKSTKSVIHYLYSAWPDFGTPEGKHLRCFFDIMQWSRSHLEDGQDKQRLTHCSAGVGRTGTFIALEFLLNELEAGVLDPSTKITSVRVKECLSGAPGSYPATSSLYNEDDPNVDIIYLTVNALRQQRRFMVQSREQYIFLYRVLDAIWTMRYQQTQAVPQDRDVDSHSQEQPARPSFRRLFRIPNLSNYVASRKSPKAAPGQQASSRPGSVSGETSARGDSDILAEDHQSVWDLARILADAQEEAEAEDDPMTDNESIDVDEISTGQ